MELAELAATAADEAAAVAGQRETGAAAGRATAAELRERRMHDAAAGRRRGRLARAVNELTELLDATGQIVAQTRQRVAGTTPDGASRRVSLHDGDARPIAKGRLGRPVEFGHKGRSSTTTTGSCWITPWSKAIRPMRRNWRPRWNGSPNGPGARRAR